MKSIVLLLGFLPFAAAAQDCKLIRDKDPYTKEVKLSTGFIHVNGASVTVDADSKEIDIMFSIEGADRCFDNNSSADIYFEGIKAKTTARNAGTMNCEGLFHFIFRNSRSTPTTLLQRFSTKKITQIIFTGNNKKQITVTVEPQEQETIMVQATCLLNEAKTLIK
jgi:hypothetical protein